MKHVDLHVHTTVSDGSCSPAGVVRLAKDAGLCAIAITDHDSVSGYAQAAAAGEELGIEVVPGIEISTRFHGPVHILGYCLDPQSDKLQPVLDWVVQDRDARNRKMAEKMAADGIPISYALLQQRYGAVIGRPHFAAFLVEQGLAESVQDAFDRYVEKGQKYYYPRNFLSIERSIEIIRQAGGVPVLAHPFQYRLDERGLRQLIEHCIASGLQGIECSYFGYSPEQRNRLLALAEEYGLLPTGGSDFHGSAKPQIPIGGCLPVPYAWLEAIRELAGK